MHKFCTPSLKLDIQWQSSTYKLNAIIPVFSPFGSCLATVSFRVAIGCMDLDYFSNGLRAGYMQATHMIILYTNSPAAAFTIYKAAL